MRGNWTGLVLLSPLTAHSSGCFFKWSPMILVTGATGTNGIQVLNQLSSIGVPARALVRDPARAQKILPHDVQLTRGDFDDPGSLDAAMEDVETVFLLCPVSTKQVE